MMVRHKMKMTDSRITEILKAFEVFDGLYKRDEVEAAVELQKEITPHLIEVLEKVLSDPAAHTESQDYYAHIYALILLGHFKEQRAHRPIIELFSLPPDLPHQLFGDVVTEDLPIIMLKTCGGSTDKIKSLILNTAADEYCRSSAMRAMVFAVVDGIIPREDVLALFGSLFTGNEAPLDSAFWSLLAHNMCDLYPEEMMGVIEKAYQDGLIAPGFIGIEDFELALSGGKEEAFEQVRAEMRRRSPEDVHGYMSGWACFTPKEQPLSSSISSREEQKRKSPKYQKTRIRKKRKRERASRKKGRR
jgi:hypothetical protein